MTDIFGSIATGFWIGAGAAAGIMAGAIALRVVAAVGAAHQAAKDRREEERAAAEHQAFSDKRKHDYLHKDPATVTEWQQPMHAKARAQEGLPPVDYPPYKPNRFLPSDYNTRAGI